MPELGGFVYREAGFFDPLTCRRIMRAMDQGVADEAEVLGEGIERREAIRRAVSIEIAPPVVREVEAALESRRTVLAGFFGLALAGREGAGFLRYPAGGFYAPHVDRAVLASWPAAARRAVAVIAFLNGSRDAERDGEFAGGVLRLFVDDTVIEVPPRQGQLVAFRADLLHEVTAVRNGTRNAIVDWFYTERR